MKFAHLVARFNGSLWLMREDALVSIMHLIESRANGVAALEVSPAQVAEAAPAAGSSLVDGVAIVEASGILGKRLSLMDALCGGCDYDALCDEVETALALPAARAVVLHFDSPGGTVVGCTEAATRLAALCAASDKPVVAFTDTECCSAAYWLASACDAIFATRSATLGSTGTKAVVRDQSEKNAKEGVKFHVFKSGTMKDILSPHRAPTEEESALLQARIDKMGSEFRAGVLAHRPGVAAECFVTAMFYDGEEAVRLGLADQLVPDLRALLADLAAP